MTRPPVTDKRTDPATADRKRFSSAILPPWARKTPKITGRAVERTLRARAASHGFESLYLQVSDDNTAARTLYRRLGFTDHHSCHYRVAPI